MENEKIEDIIPEIKLGDCHILFLDASSACTGFSIASVDFVGKKAEILSAGCLWFDAKWPHAQKYDYLYSALQNYFEVVEQIDHIVIEQYSVNTSKMSGCLVSPEIHGVVKAAGWSNGVKVTNILPQTWRSQLGIKPDVTMVGTKKKKDYKTPTKLAVLDKVPVPKEVISNITLKARQTPSDVYDSLAICLGWLKKVNITKVKTSNCEFNKHIGALDV